MDDILIGATAKGDLSGICMPGSHDCKHAGALGTAIGGAALGRFARGLLGGLLR